MEDLEWLLSGPEVRTVVVWSKGRNSGPLAGAMDDVNGTVTAIPELETSPVIGEFLPLRLIRQTV